MKATSIQMDRSRDSFLRFAALLQCHRAAIMTVTTTDRDLHDSDTEPDRGDLRGAQPCQAAGG